MPVVILSPAEVGKLVNLVASGMSQRQIAQHMGISRSTVYRTLKRLREEVEKPWQPAPCGTHAAYERHRTNGEDIDFTCRLAEAERAQQRRDQQALERASARDVSQLSG